MHRMAAMARMILFLGFVGAVAGFQASMSSMRMMPSVLMRGSMIPAATSRMGLAGMGGVRRRRTGAMAARFRACSSSVSGGGDSGEAVEKVEVEVVAPAQGAGEPAVARKGKTDFLRRWGVNEEDHKIIKIAVPAVLNNMIVPLVGAVDTFWVGRMGVALAMAGQSSANQVFSTTFWMISFLPNVITPLIAKAEASGDREEVKRHIGEAVFIAVTSGLVGMFLLTVVPDMMLSMVLPKAAAARQYAQPYLFCRGLSYVPAAVSSVAFSAFRGVLDVVTPLKVSFFTNLVNMALDPIFIFTFGMGVSGAGLATAIAEILAVITYLYVMLGKNMVTWKGMLTPPKFSSLAPLLVAGASVQLRALVLQIAFVSVTRCVQSMDATGTAAAAHAVTITVWQVAGIVLFGFGSAAGVLIPGAIAKGKKEAVRLSKRLISWGWYMGLVLGFVQLMSLPLINVLSPLAQVQQTARIPSIIASAMQIISGAVFVGEGIMMGYQAWKPLAVSSITACSGMMLVLRLYGSSLIGVWSSFCVFNSVRLLFVMHHIRKQKLLAEAEEGA